MNARRILIPAIAGLLMSPVLMAADITAGTVATSYSNEFLKTAVPADAVAGNDLKVTLGAEYAVGDILTLAFTGSALDAGTLSTITVAAVADAVGPPAVPGKSGITLGRLSNDVNGAVYRVTDIDSTGVAAPTTVGTVVPFATGGALTFDAQAVDAANTIVASFSATTDTGVALDSGGDLNSVDYITTDAQYDVSVTTALNGVIDVEDNRETFEGGVTADNLVLNMSNDTSFTQESTLTDYDVVVTGDFSWIFDTDPNTAGVQFRTGAPADVVAITGGGTCGAPDATTTTVSFTCTTPGNITLTFDVQNNDDDSTPPAAAVLPAGSFSATVDVNFDGIGAVASSEQVLSGSVGAWSLNGYQALIPYMPYGSGIGQVIYLANRGSQSGDITVDWIGLNGTSGSLGVIATLEAGTTLSIGPIINAALPTAQRTSGRLALTVTANVPAGDVQMNSQYNANGNRAFTLHEDNRP